MAEILVGIRELKTHLSRYLRELRPGSSLTITERGRPVARIVPIEPGLEERIQELVELGLLAWDGRRLPPASPVGRQDDSRSLSEILLEDRG